MENLVETEAARVVEDPREAASVLSMSQYLLYGSRRNNNVYRYLAK